MSELFLSYRNSDTGPYAGRLAEKLRAFQFVSVFEDREAIRVGEDFEHRIHAEIAGCAAVLVLIGRGWIDARDRSGQRRLDDPKDWVRIEVSVALAPDRLVVPVLFDGTDPPTASQLPSDMSALASRHAYHFDGRYFNLHADNLGRLVETALAGARAGHDVSESSSTAVASRLLLNLSIVLGLMTLGTGVAPALVPAVPAYFWVLPATMTLSTYMFWLYCVSVVRGGRTLAGYRLANE